MKHDGKFEIFLFRGPLFIEKKAARKQLVQNNHKNGSRTEDFRENTDTSWSKKLHVESYLDMLWSKIGYFGLLEDTYNLFNILLYLIER